MSKFHDRIREEKEARIKERRSFITQQVRETVKVEEVGSPFYANTFPRVGQVMGLVVDVSQREADIVDGTELVALVTELGKEWEHRRGMQLVTGRNELGSFGVQAGSRLELALLGGSIEPVTVVVSYGYRMKK